MVRKIEEVRASVRTWREIHYVSFAAYLLALGHGIMAGTDTSQVWAQLLYWSTGSLVLALCLWRFGYRRDGLRTLAERQGASDGPP